MDATSLRTFRIGSGSKAFKQEIEKWKKVHPNARKTPSYFLCHLRIAGCLERRENGKVLLKDLPLVALAPGSRPPTESVQDVQHTGFFQAVVKNAHTRMHADGNRAWRSQARLHKLKFSSVSHSKMQFTKKVGCQRLLTGTQKLDGFWKLLKKFVPTQIRTRDLRDRRICKQVLEHVKSFMWRHDAGVNLWTRLGALARKTSLKKNKKNWSSRNHANTIKKWIYVAPPCK